MSPPAVVVFGTSGYAATHLERARAMHDAGEVVLAGVCDVRELSAEARSLLPDRAVVAQDAGELFDRVAADIAIVATPPHTHLPVALAAASAGCHLLLEKPPVLDLDGFQRLSECARRAGVACQVGFQSFGSPAVSALETIVDGGLLGTLIGVGAAGAWIRHDSYYGRASWAGRRRLNGQSVVDGSLTNPFAHAVATAILLTGYGASIPERITLELYRARQIEADDTACARIGFRGGPGVVVAATLCAEVNLEPYVLLHGTQGVARWHYRTGRLEVNGKRIAVAPPIDLLRNLVANVRDNAPLIAPLSHTRAFTAFVQAVRDGVDPSAVPSEWVDSQGDGPDRRYLVHGIDRHVELAAERLALFSELGVRWAVGQAG